MHGLKLKSYEFNIYKSKKTKNIITINLIGKQSSSSLKNKLKFNISGRSIDKEAAEIKYYSDTIKDNFNFISKNKFPDSYAVIHSIKKANCYPLVVLH